jgi:hypothetical protein
MKEKKTSMEINKIRRMENQKRENYTQVKAVTHGFH